MSVADRREITLEDLASFHSRLLSLDRAGLAFDPGDDRIHEPLAQRLESITASVAIQLGRGRGMGEALADPSVVPPRYGMALQTWCWCDRSPEALDALHAPARQRAEIQSDVGTSLLQPLLILILVYLGFLVLLTNAVPKLNAMFVQMGKPPGRALQWLLVVREWMPIWAIALPLVVLLAVWLWMARREQFEFAWLPGRRRAKRTLAAAEYAINAVRRVEYRQPLPDQALLTLPEEKALGHSPALPPVLRWAVQDAASARALPSQETKQNAQAQTLRGIARIYFDLTDQLSERRKSWLPLVCGAVLGGCLVMAYGLALFAPVVELLTNIATR